MVLDTACSNLLSTFDSARKCHFLLLIKAQITREWIKLHRPLYMHYARTRVRDTLLQILCYKSIRQKIYLEINSVKLLLALSIYSSILYVNLSRFD